jgi:hypothetical protein
MKCPGAAGPDLQRNHNKSSKKSLKKNKLKPNKKKFCNIPRLLLLRKNGLM